jgi:RNA polymerase sigma-70 factor (ECF subfamily)
MDFRQHTPRLFGSGPGGVYTDKGSRYMISASPISMTPPPGSDTPRPQAPDDPRQAALISDEPTIELVVRARGGDRMAVEALLERCLPSLRRWAHGRLPPAARGSLDTGDLVQETVLHVLRRLDKFEPRHVGAMQAYLRMSVINRIRDEVRRISRHPAPVELAEEPPSEMPSPLEDAIQVEAYERYRDALATLSARDREVIVARVEAQWSVQEIAERFGMRTVDAARMAVTRALRRLSTRLLVPPAA